MTWRATLVRPGTAILDTLRVIDAGTLQIALVVDSGGRLMGTVTDGDVRRAILRGVPLDRPVETVMNVAPTTAPAETAPAVIADLMRARTLNHIPLVDAQGRVVGLEVAGRLAARALRENLVVLMAGGPGLRLRPLTESVPKPLLPVGDRPIVEIIVESFVRAGFTRLVLAVGYKAAMLRERLGDGRRLGAAIEYVVEDERLGTAGALGLLPRRPEAPFFVMNADVLTTADPRRLMAFHDEHGGAATLCVREVDAAQPYGVVEVADGRLRSIVEKPVTRHFVNAGIYVLAPRVLDLVEPGRALDMPALLGRLVARGDAPHVFPLHEAWLDIGRPADYERAREGALGAAG